MKKILIIGAGFLQMFVIKRAKELGYITYALDGALNALGFQYADFSACINIIDADACLEYAVQNQVDGVLTAATDYGVLTTSHITEKMGFLGLNYEAARLIKNKYLVRKCLCENHVDDTEQAYEVNKETDFSAIAKKFCYPVMVKPCDGSGSRGVSKVKHANELGQACVYAMKDSITHKAEIESFIIGDEYGVESFVKNGKVHILAVIKKWMTKPPYYAELGHAFPSGLSYELEKKVQMCVTKAIKALGINFGSVNMDVLITDNGKVHIIDIGARMGGNLIGSHLVPIGTGIDYIGNIVKAAVNDSADFTVGAINPVATRLLALSPGKIKRLPDFKILENDYGVKIEHHLNIGEEITSYRTNLDGCGYVIATGDCIEAAAEKAEMVKSLINQQIVRE